MENLANTCRPGLDEKLMIRNHCETPDKEFFINNRLRLLWLSNPTDETLQSYTTASELTDLIRGLKHDHLEQKLTSFPIHLAGSEPRKSFEPLKGVLRENSKTRGKKERRNR